MKGRAITPVTSLNAPTQIIASGLGSHMGGGQQGGGPHTGGGQTGGAHIGGPHTGGGQMGPPADTWTSEPEINIMLTVNAIAIDLILIKSSSKRRVGNVYLT